MHIREEKRFKIFIFTLCCMVAKMTSKCVKEKGLNVCHREACPSVNRQHSTRMLS